MKSLFEEKVRKNLEEAGLLSFEAGVLACDVSSTHPVGLAVSGGADSMSLLLSMEKILGKENVRVITVDHGIRSEKESGGDADFVSEECGKRNIVCHVHRIPQGFIESEARKNGLSIEEVARKLRYEAFDKFIEQDSLCALCTAHTLNDQSETLLMRFLTGSGAEGAFGIASRRGKIIRPLLNVSREEIEAYLVENGAGWRTDSTNSDNSFFRNRVRNVLVPILNENFPAWRQNVLSGGEKSYYDNLFFNELLEKENLSAEGSAVSVPLVDFYSKPMALRRRIVLKAVNLLGFGSRFPFKIISQICQINLSQKKSCAWSFKDIKVFTDEKSITFRREKESKIGENRGFAYIFEEKNGVLPEQKIIGRLTFSFFDGYVLAASEENPACNKKISARLPLCIRSPEAGDKIRGGDGKYKKIGDIFSDWKVELSDRTLIPVVQELDSSMEIKALLGNCLGYDDWIVRASAL